MLFLKSLKIDCFGSIVNQELDLANYHNNILSLKAKNEDSGGASGAGKTTLFKAIEYVFCLIPSSKHYKNRFTGQNPDVTIHLQWNDKPLKIRRYLKNISTNEMEIWVNNELVSHGGKEAEDYLYTKIIKMPKIVFKRLLHKPQDEKMFFAYLTPSQIFEYILQILNMDSYEAMIEEVSDSIKNVENRIEETNKLFNPIQERVEENKALLERDLKELEIKEGMFLDMETRKQCLTESLNAIVKEKEFLKQEIILKKDEYVKLNKTQMEKLNRDLLKIKQEKQEFINANENEIKSLERLLSEKQKAISLLLKEKEFLQKSNNNDLVKELSFLKENLKQIEQKIQHLEDQKCPTCFRPWAEGENELLKHVNLKKDLVLKIEKLESEIKKWQNEKEAKKQSLEKEIGELEKEVLDLKSGFENQKRNYQLKLSQLDSAINQIVNSLDEEKQKLVSGLQNVLKEMSNKFDDLNNTEIEKRKVLDELGNQIMSLSGLITALKTKIDVYTKEIQNGQGKIQQYKQELEILIDQKESLKILKEEIKAYILYHFETFLTSLINRANEILSKIPNTLKVGVSFSLTKESVSGRTKEGVHLKFYDHGIEVPLDSFSGGEQTSIGLALDIAFSEELSRFNGNYLNLWMLDEPFNGLDVISKIAFLDLLKQQTNRNLIIVEHDSVINEYCDGNINVVKMNNMTYISN